MIITLSSYENISEFGSVLPSLNALGFFHQCMEDDLENVIFNTDQFAINISYLHKTGEQKVYTILKNDPSYSANVGAEVNVSDREMMIRLQESKLVRYPTNKDVATVNGVKFNVIDVQPDGVGTVILMLQRVGNFE